MWATVVAGLIAACGLFSLVCAAKNYDWFMEHRKARALSAIIGRTGARVFYITLGVALIVAGILFFVYPPAELR